MIQRTVLLVKPDATAKNLSGEILARLEGGGYRLIAIRSIHLTETIATDFYGIHKGKPFFEDLMEYITSGTVVAMVLEKENAVADLRIFIGGETDPAKASEGSIRRDFGESIGRNAVHASDSPESAEREIPIFFTERDLV